MPPSPDPGSAASLGAPAGPMAHPATGASTGAIREAAPVAPPASAGEIRRAYLDQMVLGYLFYGVGAVSAFIAVALSLSDSEAGLHSSALAAGVVVAGLSADRLDHVLGSRALHLVAMAVVGLGTALLAWAPAFALTLSGAAAIGLGAGVILGHINQTLAAGGGALARVRFGRSTLVAMLASLAVPLVIGIGEALGLGWRVAFLPAAVLIALAFVGARSRGESTPDARTVQRRLPRAYWLAWLLVVLVVAIEFATLFWGSTLVARQTGVSLGDATLILAAFFAGMVAGRVALSFHAVGDRDPIALMRAGIAIAMVGTLVTWTSGAAPLSALGLLGVGLGVGMLFPLGASVTLATSPDRPRLASARMAFASGFAILVAPFVLGLVADLTSVATAWLLIPATCLAALALTVAVAGPAPGSTGVVSLPGEGLP